MQPSRLCQTSSRLAICSILNNTRVIAARLLGHRVPSGGAVECLLLSRMSRSDEEPSEEWEALVHPGQKLREGARFRIEGSAGALIGRDPPAPFLRSAVDPTAVGIGGKRRNPDRGAWPRSAAAVHQAVRYRRRSRALPDGVCLSARIGRSTDRGPALHAGDSRCAVAARYRSRRDHAARGIRDVQAGARRHRRTARGRCRALRHPRGRRRRDRSCPCRRPPHRRCRDDDDAGAGRCRDAGERTSGRWTRRGDDLHLSRI